MTEIRQGIEKLIGDLVDGTPATRIEALVGVRDEVARMIADETPLARKAIETELAKLKADVAAKQKRLDSIEALVTKPRAVRSDAGKKRAKPDTRSIAAISRGDSAAPQA